MGAAEDRSHDDVDQVEVPDLTPTERARLRALLELIDRAALGKVDRPRPPRLEPPAPTAEDFAELRAKRRRRAHRHG